MKKVTTQNYRGVVPVELVTVLEGNGTEGNPFTEVSYVLEHRYVGGYPRMVTIGKVTPLTDEEREWFNK